jgi:hypothetical protein
VPFSNSCMRLMPGIFDTTATASHSGHAAPPLLWALRGIRIGLAPAATSVSSLPGGGRLQE